MQAIALPREWMAGETLESHGVGNGEGRSDNPSRPDSTAPPRRGDRGLAFPSRSSGPVVPREVSYRWIADYILDHPATFQTMSERSLDHGQGSGPVPAVEAHNPAYGMRI